jgi:H+/Cl- antiporter ClcA
LPARQRKWALVAGLSGIIVMVATLFFFIPILQKTQVTRGAGLSGEEITTLVKQFKTWNWGRWLLLIGGWVAGLRALSLSPPAESR